ncbi:MAG TPA: 30S ribosomal protein S20 [Candidatus Nitrosotenuis sp.]|jgi:small subunit ribosomal protein S20|nr:30S ribosomal protein S20 [Candidatus Nitrosotenuis sp.]
MANHKSAKKCIRQIEKRTAINRNRISRVRTYVKKVELAITSEGKESATVALKEAQKELMRGVSKGVLHKNTVARKISRLSKRIKSLSA